MSEKKLVILCGTDEAIKYFKEGVLPSFDTYTKSDYGSLDLTEEDMKSDDVIRDTKKAVNFIYDDDSTHFINNIFLFIHSTDLDFVESITNEIKETFQKKFKKIKFVYLTTDEHPISQSRMNDIIDFQKSIGLDYNLDDMMKNEVETKNINSLREKLYMLGDAIEISTLLDETPNDVREILVNKFNDIVSKI